MVGYTMAILGISAHKTTIYHNQSVQLLNANWMADPIQTAAMQGAVSGTNPADSIMGAIQSGTGYNLRQYYSYATRRFGKRDCHWSIATINSSGSMEFGLNRERVLEILPELKEKEWRIAVDVDYLSFSGSKSYQDMNDLFNWNSFTEPLADGTNIVITGADEANTYIDYPDDLGQSWMVGFEVSTGKNIPALILDPKVDISKITGEYYLLAQTEYKPELSGGIVYWISTKGFEPSKISNKVIERHTQKSFNALNIEEDINKKYETNRISDWKNESINTVVTNTSDLPDDEDEGRELEEIPILEPVETVTIYYQKFKSKNIVGTNPDTQKPIYQYEVEVWHEDGKIVYDEEGYIWATQTEESHTGVGKYFQLRDTSNVSVNNYGNLFKFYPYLPTKEHERDILEFSQAQKLLDALKRQSDIGSTNETESDAPKANREGTKTDQSNKKSSGLDGRTERVLLNKKRYTKKIRVHHGMEIEPSDERHLVKMGEYLNTDYKEAAATLAVSEDYSKIYHNSLIPAVTLGSNFDEVNDYWYKFFKRLHTKLGQSTYLNFITEVSKLPDDCTYESVYKLPRTELSYGIEGSGQFSGFLSFTFIREFIIDGTIRTTKRKRNLKEVRLGKHTELYKIKGKSLKNKLIEPSKELIWNDYYTSTVSGKQYNIGAANLYDDLTGLELDDRFNSNNINSSFASISLGSNNSRYIANAVPIYQDTDTANLTFGHYGYTYFCKQLSNGKLHVIAVAGLIAGQSRSGYVVHHHGSVNLDGITVASRAIHELAMFWERNRKRYVEKVPSDKIDVKVTFTSGSKRKKLETNIQTFFLLPLDYKTVSRLSGASIMRLADRAVVTLNWSKIRVRRLRGWVKTFIQIVGIIVTIVGAYYGYGGSTGMTIMAMAKALAIAIAVQIAVKYAIKLLIKVFGLKGVIALIVAITVTVIAMVLGGYNNTSSLPYASQTAQAQVASTALTQTANQSISQTLLQNIQTMVQETTQSLLKDVTQMTTQELVSNSASFITKLADGATDYINQQTKSIAKQMEEATENYNKHMTELQELQELNQERTAPYDVKAVMSALMNKTRLIDPSGYLESALLADNTLASEEYISGFIQNKLNIEPSTFDSIGSLDYSLQMKG